MFELGLHLILILCMKKRCCDKRIKSMGNFPLDIKSWRQLPQWDNCYLALLFCM